MQCSMWGLEGIKRSCYSSFSRPQAAKPTSILGELQKEFPCICNFRCLYCSGEFHRYCHVRLLCSVFIITRTTAITITSCQNLLKFLLGNAGISAIIVDGRVAYTLVASRTSRSC
eukprot:6327207-Amphidinium_carterae.1